MTKAPEHPGLPTLAHLDAAACPGRVESAQLSWVVAVATLAPSVHNTQPWRFVARHDALDLWLDRSQAVPASDPQARELHISCGAALEHARLAIRSLGRRCAVRLLPDPAQPDHLARIAIDGYLAPTALEVALVQAAPHRHTDRSAFQGQPALDLVADLASATAAAGAWLRVPETPGERAVLASLLATADDLLLDDEAYRWELQHHPLTRGSTPRATSSYRLRTVPGTVAADPATAPADHPLLAVLGTVGDGPRDWLVAGGAMAQVLLRLAAAEVSASPLSHVVEVPATRAALAQSLGVIGSVQMVLRIGYGAGGVPAPRRSVHEVLTFTE